jgi:hypothetical protein
VMGRPWSKKAPGAARPGVLRRPRPDSSAEEARTYPIRIKLVMLLGASPRAERSGYGCFASALHSMTILQIRADSPRGHNQASRLGSGDGGEGTAVIAAHPLPQLSGRQHPCRLRHRPFPVRPLRLHRVQPRAFAGQGAHDEAHPLARPRALPVVLPYPRPHRLAHVPTGVVPHQGQHPAAQRPPSRLSVARLVSPLTRAGVSPASTLPWAASSSVHTLVALPKVRGRECNSARNLPASPLRKPL